MVFGIDAQVNFSKFAGHADDTVTKHTATVATNRVTTFIMDCIHVVPNRGSLNTFSVGVGFPFFVSVICIDLGGDSPMCGAKSGCLFAVTSTAYLSFLGINS